MSAVGIPGGADPCGKGMFPRVTGISEPFAEMRVDL
jgi:hypothetical protein